MYANMIVRFKDMRTPMPVWCVTPSPQAGRMLLYRDLNDGESSYSEPGGIVTVPLEDIDTVQACF